MLTCRVPGMYNELAALPDVSRLVDSFFTNSAMPMARNFPAVNMWEDDQSLYVEAELPGYALEDIEITTLGNELTIAGTRTETAPEEATFHRRERMTGGASQFKRSLRIGIPVNVDKVSAKLEQGVLSITLPKAEAAKPRKIQVKPA